jgi:ribonuclease P protein component
MAKQFGLGKKEKLKSRKQIDALFTTGKSLAVFPIRVNYQFLPADEGAPAQVGFTVSKKYFKKAVDRNRGKRLLREAYRLQKTDLYKHLGLQGLKAYLFFVYTDKNLTSFSVIKEAMNSCLKKIQQKATPINEKSA